MALNPPAERLLRARERVWMSADRVFTWGRGQEDQKSGRPTGRGTRTAPLGGFANFHTWLQNRAMRLGWRLVVLLAAAFDLITTFFQEKPQEWQFEVVTTVK